MAEHQPDTELTFPISQNQPATHLLDRVIAAKDTEDIQVTRGVITLPVNQGEYYSRSAMDFLSEQRGTVTAAARSVLINFFVGGDTSQVVKWVEITCPTASSSDLFVNFNGGFAGPQNGSLQVRAGETRGYWIPVNKIEIASDGVGTATYRVTYGW